MKVILSETESYEIEIPKVANAKEFQSLLSKLDGVAKILQMNLRLNTNFNEFRNEFNTRTAVIRNSKRRGKVTHYTDRKNVLDIMQYFYQGTKEDRVRISTIIGKTPEEIQKRFWSLIRKWNIQPNEVGLVNFQNQKFGIRTTHIPNYTIKSHTGLYDAVEDNEDN